MKREDHNEKVIEKNGTKINVKYEKLSVNNVT